MHPDGPGRLHVLTDETIQTRFSHVELAGLAAEGGADIVQLREKRLRATRALVDLARGARRALGARACRLVVNDRVDVALAARADGVHLGPEDLEPGIARSLAGARALVGATANDLERARALEGQPIDYLGVGPVYGTASKSDPAPRLGIEALHRIAQAVGIPVIAIGSVRPDRVGELIDAGAYGVAVLSDVVAHADPAARVARHVQALGRALARKVSS